MKWVLHQLRRDARRFAPHLVLYLGLTVLWTDRHTGWLGLDFVAGAGWLAWTAWVFALVLAAWAVLADSPADDDAFWLTRPVPRRSMAVAKLGFVALFLLLPVVLLVLAPLAVMGLELSDAARIGLEVALTLGAPLALAVAVASLARGFAGFFALGIGLGVVWALGLSGIVMWLVDPGSVTGGWHLATFLAAATLVAAATVTAQYLWRRRSWTAPAIVLALVAVAVVSMDAPWAGDGSQWLGQHPVRTELAPLDRPMRFADTDGEVLVGTLRLDGAPADLVYEVDRVEADLSFDDGTVLSSTRFGITPAARAAERRFVGAEPDLDAPPAAVAEVETDLFAVPAELFDARGSEEAVYRADVELTAYRVRPLVLPLASRARRVVGTEVWWIADAWIDGEALRLQLEGRSLASGAFMRAGFGGRQVEHASILLRSRHGGTARIPTVRWSDGRSVATVGLGGDPGQRSSYDVSLRGTGLAGPGLDDLELWLLRLERVGPLRVTHEAEGFRMVDYLPAAPELADRALPHSPRKPSSFFLTTSLRMATRVSQFRP